VTDPASGDSDETPADGETTDTATDGGTTTDVPETDADTVDPTEPVKEQFQNIHELRKRRAVGWLVLVSIIGFLFLQALSATELIERADFNWEFFWQSVKSYVPIASSNGIPYIDVWQYYEFIQRNNLLYDPEIGGLLFSGQFYTFFFEELGVFMIFGQAGITLAMGFAGTLIGFPLALLFGVLGSERVTPFPFNFLFRGTMSFIRSIPALVWVLVFIPLAGLGAAAATIAIAVDTIGNLGRLFVDELEEVEDGPIEAMQTTGANRPQIIVFGMLSQVRTSFIAWTLYILEINVRIAVTVGVYGAGGLGQIVEVQRGLRQYTHMMAGLLCIFALIITVELFSQRLRSRLRSDEKKRGWRELIFGFPNRMAKSIFK